jgi:hypothetical protein
MKMKSFKKMIHGIDFFRFLRGFSIRLSFFVLQFLLFTGNGNAAMTDRVIAFVDDEAITRSELEEEHSEMTTISPNITEEEVLNTMINRVVILREAKKYRIEGASPDDVINEYIDLKVRAFIRISEAEIEKYYDENARNLSGKEYDEVREEIEQYLTERKLNMRLKETLEDLKKTAYIKILPYESPLE